MIKLSIITINLNNVIGLKKTIGSVISQTFSKFEYIIIDGGSTDGSVELLRSDTNKINFWISEPDRGIYNAMNKGIVHSGGEYCLFLNSGDILLNEDVLSSVFSKDHDEDILYGDCIVLENGKGKTVYNFPDESKLSFRFFLRNSFCHQAMFFKKRILVNRGMFNENLKYASDWEFYLLAIFKHNVSIKKIETIVSIFDTSGITSNPINRDEMLFERETILKKYFPHFLYDYAELERLDNMTPLRIYRFLKIIPRNFFKLLYKH